MKVTYYTSVPIIINFCFKIGLLLRLLRKSTTNARNKYEYQQLPKRRHHILRFYLYGLSTNSIQLGVSGYFMGNSRNNQPGRLYTSLAMLVTAYILGTIVTRMCAVMCISRKQPGRLYLGLSLFKHSFCGKHKRIFLMGASHGCICCTCCICCLKNNNQLCLACNK